MVRLKQQCKMKPRIIAFYLPQFHPIPENDEWWGKGFTEWTNVGKAKPLWKGHDQPRVPADLGYYDLRVPEVREQQAELAREAGVTAFCYWHYWFGNGRRLLERVFDEVLESGKPDFPFCLGWANHSWYAKRWTKDVAEDKLLIEQTYPGVEDARMHFEYLLKAFKDKRYVKIGGKPFFLIFDVNTLPKEYLDNFRKWAKDAGFPDLYIVANVYDTLKEKNEYLKLGYDAVLYNRNGNFWYDRYIQMNLLHKIFSQIRRHVTQWITRRPMGALDYAEYHQRFITDVDREKAVIPMLMPQWDHSPRSGNKAATIYYNAQPKYFYQHAKDAINAIKDKPEEEQILILKSWNEWGEGNYMEPDITNGKGYINALRRAIDEE